VCVCLISGRKTEKERAKERERERGRSCVPEIHWEGGMCVLMYLAEIVCVCFFRATVSERERERGRGGRERM
jgi:hypothetical protein